MRGNRRPLKHSVGDALAPKLLAALGEKADGNQSSRANGQPSEDDKGGRIGTDGQRQRRIPRAVPRSGSVIQVFVGRHRQ